MTTSAPTDPVDQSAGVHPESMESADAGDAPANESVARSWPRLIRRVMFGWAITAVVVLGLAWATVTTAEVLGPSMEPTLFTGDTIVASKHSTPNVGDVVTADLLLTGGARRPVVKRVVATGGDVVSYLDCRLRRNGQSVDEPYLGPTLSPGACGVSLQPTVVPDGHVFLMGDNRERSIDSRTHGAFDLDQIRGVMLFSF